MKYDTYEKMNLMLQNLLQERNSLQRQIDENDFQINETQFFSEELLGKEEDDFKFFSPRRVGNLQKSELEQSRIKKASYEKKNIQLKSERDKLDSIIEVLQSVAEENIVDNPDAEEEPTEDYENELEILDTDILAMLNVQIEEREEIVGKLSQSVLKNLSRQIHRLDISNKFIRQDPMRAQMELTNVTKSLNKIADEIKALADDQYPIGSPDYNLRNAFEKIAASINEQDIYEMDLRLEDVSCETRLEFLILYCAVQKCMADIQRQEDVKKISFYCESEEDKIFIGIEYDGKIETGEDIENPKDIETEEFEEKSDGTEEKDEEMYLIEKQILLLGGRMSCELQSNGGKKIVIEIPVVDSEIFEE